MFRVDVSARDLSPFVELVGQERVEAVTRRAATVRALLGPHAIWNVSSTAAGGGVAEMLRSLLRYIRGLGVDVRWTVLEGDPGFFFITKRIHNALHDQPGDGSPLGPPQAAIYERVSLENLVQLERMVRPGDVVVCHDPQTAGLVPELLRFGAHVVWRCHIGHEQRGREVDAGWAFLRKYLECVPLAVFSRGAYAPSWLPRTRAVVLPPNIDAFSVKNQWMPEAAIRAVLAHSRLIDEAPGEAPVFVREDGGTGHVLRTADVLGEARPPAWDTPLVVQVSRWDRMKDHAGLLRGFARLVEGGERRSELVLAGPSVRGVADDPEGPEVLVEVEAAWRALPLEVRRRARLVQLPMVDPEENAAMVNALQRHASVIVQKSLREGFGLTVTEAMWKRRPVVASAVGGIQDQIRDGVDGILLRDPTDPDETAGALRRVLEDRDLAEKLGAAAYERVRRDYLTIASLERWASLVEALLAQYAGARPPGSPVGGAPAASFQGR